MTARPQPGDAADYYFTYIDRLPDGDLLEQLESQGHAVVAELRAITERYR
jgi:hypothetical protein